MMSLRRFKAAIPVIGCFAFLALAPSAMAAVTITPHAKDANSDPITTPLTVGKEFHSGVTIWGATAPGGTLTFGTFPPSDPGCAGTAIDLVNWPGAITGDSNYQSGPPGAIATEVGQYRMTATLTGGPDGGATLPCTNAFTVIKTHPSLAVVPSAPTVAAGSPIHATATLTGSFMPTAQATVLIFGPDDAACAGAPVFTANVPGPGPVYVGPNFTPTTVGTYHAKASFIGDATNDGDTANCGPSTAFEVTPAPPPPSPGGGSSAETGLRAAALKKCKKKKSKKAKKKCRKKAAKLPA
jgi:hypothetical protein